MRLGAWMRKRDTPFIPQRVNIPLNFDSKGRYIATVTMVSCNVKFTGILHAYSCIVSLPEMDNSPSTSQCPRVQALLTLQERNVRLAAVLTCKLPRGHQIKSVNPLLRTDTTKQNLRLRSRSRLLATFRFSGSRRVHLLSKNRAS